MTEWWNSLTSELQFFYFISLTSSAILIIQMIMMFFGGMGEDMDVDAPDGDVHGHFDSPSDVKILSIRTIIAFFVGFGWTGVICLKQGMGLSSSLVIALGVGALFMAMVIYLMKMLYSLRDSGNIHYENAIGKIGSVYAPISEKQTAPGQIEIMIQGRVRFIEAFTKSDKRLSAGERVKVVELINQSTVMVEPLNG